MLPRILFLSLLSATAGFANPIDCATGYPHHKIDVEIYKDHDAGMLKINGHHFALRCTKDLEGINLLCHGSRATTIYTVKIHRVTHSRRIWEYKGHIGQTIGGFAGSIYSDLGELQCAEWPEGSFPH